MADHSRRATAERTEAAKPWPVLVAVGITGSEVGIVVGLLPVAVVGLVVFAVSVAGILADADYVERPLALAIQFGVAFVVGGAGLAAHGTGAFTIGPLEPLSGLTSRGIALVLAGIVTIVGAEFVRSRRAKESGGSVEP
ncbi:MULTISPECIES: hypothetical protein [unclassified Natrinema]|uniref:DUF7541 family protein n=1 Tax=unclassified Natrinema TaxID=2622230 RepID=UPI00026D48B2|nr:MULTISPECIES: hypothetical protein [unclassified Natrinema]AFO58471.1 hypothetical protein NJ7G_3253 [Natrinema sp. J7-2]